MVLRERPICALLLTALLSPIAYAVAGSSPQNPSPAPVPFIPPDAAQQEAAKKDLPLGDGRDAVIRLCGGCHLYTVMSVQRKSEDKWTDTVIEMRSRGASGSDDELTQVVEYLAKNFGPDSPLPKININTAPATVIASGLSLTFPEGQAIADYRDKHGKFKDLTSLKQVPGVDSSKIDAAQDRIEF